VMIFLDIDKIKTGVERSDLSRSYTEKIIETVEEPLLVLNGEMRIENVNPAFHKMFDPEGTGSNHPIAGNDGLLGIPRIRTAISEVRRRNITLKDVEIEHEFPTIGRRKLLVNACRIGGSDPKDMLILLTFRDVT